MHSKQQYVPALYTETPIVFTPSLGDLERLLLAVSELTNNQPSSNGNRHLIIRSLTPLLENASTTGVCTVLERISEFRAGTGLCFLGLNYTAHSEETMSALTKRVDGVLWVTNAADNHLQFEYRPTRGRHNQPSTRGDD